MDWYNDTLTSPNWLTVVTLILFQEIVYIYIHKYHSYLWKSQSIGPLRFANQFFSLKIGAQRGEQWRAGLLWTPGEGGPTCTSTGSLPISSLRVSLRPWEDLCSVMISVFLVSLLNFDLRFCFWQRLWSFFVCVPWIRRPFCSMLMSSSSSWSVFPCILYYTFACRRFPMIEQMNGKMMVEGKLWNCGNGPSSDITL